MLGRKFKPRGEVIPQGHMERRVSRGKTRGLQTRIESHSEGEC